MRGLALDPAFRNIGIVEFNLVDGIPIPYNLDIIQTKKGKGKVGLDDLRASRKIHKGLQNFIQDKDIIIAELPTGSQSSRAAMASGVIIGILAGLENLTTVSPNQVKNIVGKNATKDEIIEWGMRKYPELNWPKTKAKQEHIADSLAVMETLR